MDFGSVMNQVRPRRGDPLHPPVPLGEGGGVPRVTSVRCVAVPRPLCLGTPRWVGSLLEGVPRGVVGSEGDLGRGSGRVRSAGKWGGGSFPSSPTPPRGRVPAQPLRGGSAGVNSSAPPAGPSMVKPRVNEW